VEYNPDPDFHSGVKQKEIDAARTPASKKKGAAAALRAQSAANSATPAADASEPQTPTRSNGDAEAGPSRRSPSPAAAMMDDDRGLSPVSTASSASEPPLAQRVKMNGSSHKATPTPAPAPAPVPVTPTPKPQPAEPAPTPAAAAAAPPSPSKSWVRCHLMYPNMLSATLMTLLFLASSMVSERCASYANKVSQRQVRGYLAQSQCNQYTRMANQMLGLPWQGESRSIHPFRHRRFDVPGIS